MGASFVNFQVRSADQAAVAAAAAEVVRGAALVSPASAGGWVTVYDQAGDGLDAHEVGRLAGELSARLGTAVLALLVHDSSLFVYQLFDGGDLLDEYHSHPGPTHDRAGVDREFWLSGRPDVLAVYGPPGTRADALAAALDRADGPRGPGFAAAVGAEERVKPLAEAMGIDPGRAMLGYADVGRQLATLSGAADYLRVDGRPARPRPRGPVPPRLPPR